MRHAASPVARHRERKARQGFARVEIAVRAEDAVLVRRIVAALADPAREEAARTLLRQHFAAAAPVSLKALLAAAPLEDIHLQRSRDPGRSTDL